jgi:putative membrane protein
MWGYDYPAYWFGFMPAPLGMIITIFVLVFIFVWLMRYSFGGRRGHYRERSALDVLDERYARGDIDKSEYDERRRTLSR